MTSQSNKSQNWVGLKSVELTIWNEEFLNDYFTEKTNKYLASLAKDNGLKINDVFCIPPDISAADKNKRMKSVEFFKRVLEAVKQLGSDMVVALPPNPFELDIPYIGGKPMAQEWTYEIPKGLDWKQNWRDMIDTFQKILRSLRGHGDEGRSGGRILGA